MDISWISREAKTLHDVFTNLFYVVAGLLLTVSVVCEYFKAPLGGVPQFGHLVGRTVVASLLLVSYPEIANMVSEVSTSLASKLGNLNDFHDVLTKAGEALEKVSWSWGSVGDAFIFIVSYLSFFLLHVTIYFFDAAIVYCWMLLYVFSPLLIVLFILPATSQATSALFRSMFEVSAWKVVWAVLGTLLWSTAIHNFEDTGQGKNFITSLTFTLILSLSVLCTPMVVRSILGKGVSSLASSLSAAAGTAVVASAVGPASMATLATGPSNVALSGMRKAALIPLHRTRSYLKERRREKGDPAPRGVPLRKKTRLEP